MRRCHACGGENAAHRCGGCFVVPYCSTVCLQNDRKSHKAACRETQLKKCALDLMHREMSWLKDLPEDDKRQLEEYFDDEELPFPYNHHMTFVSYALVLCGVLPCHYHSVLESTAWPSYTERFCQEVAVPWFTEHKQFLEKRGFRFEIFQDSTDFCLCERLPRLNARGCQNNLVLHPAPFFWNKKHADADAISEIYFQGEETQATVEDGIDHFFHVFRFLGMLSSTVAQLARPNVVPITFELPDARTLLGDANACCSPFFNRVVDSTTAGDAGEFFAHCRKGLATFDIPIKFDIRNDNVEHYNTNLTAEGYARLVVGAACGDRQEAMGYFNSLSAKASLGKRKVARTKQLIREYAQHEVC